MKYDFTIVQRRIAEEGMTLTELAEMCEKADPKADGFHHSTFSKAFKRGTASQRTAKALSKALKIPLKRMLRKTA